MYTGVDSVAYGEFNGGVEYVFYKNSTCTPTQCEVRYSTPGSYIGVDIVWLMGNAMGCKAFYSILSKLNTHPYTM